MPPIPSTAAAAEGPLACVPGAIPAVERPAHFQLMGRLFSTAVRERRDVADGYAYRFGAESCDDVTRWIANERRCCPFLTFELTVTPAGGPIWVTLTGPAGARDFLDAELPAFTS